jgi:Peptidase family S41
MKWLLPVAAALALAVGASGAPTDAAGDVRTLFAEMERLHPNLYHSTSRDEFRAFVDALAERAPRLGRDELLVEVMRLAALPGEREGHAGVFPFDDAHRTPLRLYPLRLYRFADGLFVVRAADRSVVGSRVVAVDGMPIADVVAKVRPLSNRDNELSLISRLPYYLLTAEVLHGLGITPTADSATFTLESHEGVLRQVRLEPIPAARYTSTLGVFNAVVPPGVPEGRLPVLLRTRNRPHALRTLDRGRVVYAAYNSVIYPGQLPDRLIRLARAKKVRRVVVDLRLNGGGDNTQYTEFVDALRSRAVNRPGRLVVLIGRDTFSAAANFAAVLDLSTRARFVGEPTGGSPNTFSNARRVLLPALGLSVYVSTWWTRVVPEDARVAVAADVEVPVTSADFFAGRDPVLRAALALR